MSVNAQITLAPEARRALARIERFPDAMGRAIAATLDRENEMTVGRSVEHYLSGPRPRRLGVRSGRLRRSIRRLPTKVRGNAVESAIGTNVEYAGAHERGFSGSVQVPAHSRTVTQAFGVPIAPVRAQVRAHSRQVRIPARPFLRPAVADRIPDYETSLSRAIVRAAQTD